jgi:hypothetical protein
MTIWDHCPTSTKFLKTPHYQSLLPDLIEPEILQGIAGCQKSLPLLKQDCYQEKFA